MNRVGHYAGAVFLGGLALGSAVAGLGNLLDGPILAGVMMVLGAFPASLLAWLALRGAIDRRHCFTVSARGLSIVSLGGQTRSYRWDEIRTLHQPGSFEPHFRIGVGSTGEVFRIYYGIGNAIGLLESCALMATSASDAYEIPLHLERPSLPRRLIVPLVVLPPIIALGVLSLINGEIGGFIFLEGFVAVLPAIWILGQVGTPSKITVVAEGIGAQIRLRPRDFIAWAEVTAVEFVIAPKKSLLVRISTARGRPLMLGLSGFDPIRLFGLIQRTRWDMTGGRNGE